jgi:signal peptidase
MPEEEAAPRKKGGRRRKSEAALLARDLLTAVVIVAILFGLIFAYTQRYPPMVVVESSSMQHSDTVSYVGVIDTGDLVFVQAVRSKADVVTYVEGRNTGYETYGLPGDVIIYRQLGTPGQFTAADPIIHRAILFMEWNATGGGFDIPGLDGPGNAGLWGCESGCTTVNGARALLGRIWVQGSGWRGTVDLNAFLSVGRAWSPDGQPISGYATKGDNNDGIDGWFAAQVAVDGKARLEIPWFGLIKLTVFPTVNCCNAWGCVGSGRGCYATRNSWDALVASLVIFMSLPFALDIALAYREERRRRGERAPARAGRPESKDPGPGGAGPRA